MGKKASLNEENKQHKKGKRKWGWMDDFERKEELSDNRHTVQEKHEK